MSKLNVLNNQGKKTESIDLPEDIFGVRVNQDVIHQAVIMYQAAQRQGTASTKERGSVSGGGAKPYRQKGTGRARAGSNRSPLWKGGGTVFGPTPRDFSYKVPKKVRVAALRETLNDKFQTENLLCIDELKAESPKTKDFVKVLENLKIEKNKTLALSDHSDEKFLKASRNIPYVTVMRVQDANAYDIIKNKKLLVSKKAFNALLKRIK